MKAISNAKYNSVAQLQKDWKATRLDFVATVKARLGWRGLTADEYVNDGFIFLATPNIKGEGEIDFDDVNYITRERFLESPEIIVEVGDVLIAKDGSTLGITNVVRWLPAPTTVNSSIAIIRPRKARRVDSRFLFRWLTSAPLQGIIEQMKDGQGVPHLFQADIKKFPILLPPMEEQIAIVDFLDSATTKLTELIRKKRTLIQKLTEKRAALISRTVTRGLPPEAARSAGLDPYTKFKPSGIEWLGEVPEHWRVLPFKRVCFRVDVGIAEAATHAYCDDGVPIVRSTNVRPNLLDTRDILRIEPWFAEKNKSKTLRAGDLVTVRTGYPGTTAMVPEQYDGSQCFTLVMSRLKRTEVPRFFSYFFNADPGVTYFQMEGWGTAQTNISVPIVQHMPVVRPPAPEQAAIVEFLDRQTARIDTLVTKVEDAIGCLQEYRTALITAAVTGKIDVRNAGKKARSGVSE
jgi:type I restriction enzyme S subunit